MPDKHNSQNPINLDVNIDTANIDAAIEKANQLKNLLLEVKGLIDSL